MSTKKQRMYMQIERHGENLCRVFGLDADPVTLCKKLHTLENKAHRLSTMYCNGDIDSEEWEAETVKILKKVNQITGYKAKGVPVFINADCRGYALKIREKFVSDNNLTIHRDFGGYGIIAPEFDGSL